MQDDLMIDRRRQAGGGGEGDGMRWNEEGDQ